jgi:predicted peptidase
MYQKYHVSRQLLVMTFILSILNACSGGNSGTQSSTVPDTQGSALPPQNTAIFKQRLNGFNSAPLDYLEYTPVIASEELAPLIIFNHGSGATNTGNLNDVTCCGLPPALVSGDYNTELPFVILAPQRRSALDVSTLKLFIDFAIQNYNVDPNRVFLIGWSQGANISARYAVEYPLDVAALVVLAGGFFQGVPANVCDAGELPVWGFSGQQDSGFITQATLDTVNAFAQCSDADSRYTSFRDAGHFEASTWPFITSEVRNMTGDDPYQLSVFSWMLN